MRAIKRKQWIELGLAAIALSVCSLAANAQQYYLYDTHLHGTVTSSGFTASGGVSGSGIGPDGQAHPAIWRAGVVTQYGPPYLSLASHLTSTSMNDAGQMAFYTTTSSAIQDRTYRYDNGTVTDIGYLGLNPQGERTTLSYDINASGQITGWTTAGAENHAYLWSNAHTAMTDLGTLGGQFSEGLDLNDAGQVVGDSMTASGQRHAFLYSNGAMEDLGALGGDHSMAWGVSSNGLVTGTTGGSDSQQTQAFLYSNGAMQIIGPPLTGLGFHGSTGYGVNSSGQVTGSFFVPPLTPGGNPFVTHGFLYSNGTFTDLNSFIDPSSPLALYLTLEVGIAINDDGWIVAQGLDKRTGEESLYLLSTTPVPLPAAFWLLLCGLGVFSVPKAARAARR